MITVRSEVGVREKLVLTRLSRLGAQVTGSGNVLSLASDTEGHNNKFLGDKLKV